MDRNSKRKVSCCKNPIKIWDVNVDNIVISKFAETKAKNLIGDLGKTIRPLLLIMPKMNGYVKTFKVKEGNKDVKWVNMLRHLKLKKEIKIKTKMSFHIDNKLLEKYWGE